MKKTYLLEGLDCANCAAEVERNVAKLDNVNSASVNFLTLKMVLDVNEEGFDETYMSAAAAPGVLANTMRPIRRSSRLSRKPNRM